MNGPIGVFGHGDQCEFGLCMCIPMQSCGEFNCLLVLVLLLLLVKRLQAIQVLGFWWTNEQNVVENVPAMIGGGNGHEMIELKIIHGWDGGIRVGHLNDQSQGLWRNVLKQSSACPSDQMGEDGLFGVQFDRR